jgi:hypothetical protein
MERNEKYSKPEDAAWKTFKARVPDKNRESKR